IRGSVIAPRRNNSAHLHLAWRAKSAPVHAAAQLGLEFRCHRSPILAYSAWKPVRRAKAQRPRRRHRRDCWRRPVYAVVIHDTFFIGIRAMTTLVLSVRVNEEERALLEAASTLARTSLSDFIRRKALDAAEADILERRVVTIPAKDWEAFEA